MSSEKIPSDVTQASVAKANLKVCTTFDATPLWKRHRPRNHGAARLMPGFSDPASHAAPRHRADLGLAPGNPSFTEKPFFDCSTEVAVAFRKASQPVRVECQPMEGSTVQTIFS